MPLQCPHCHSETVVKNGTRRPQDEPVVQSYRCRDCHRNFNERTGTPMARLRIPSNGVEFALKNRSEGMGARATGRLVTASARGQRSDVRRRRSLHSRGREPFPPLIVKGGR